MAGLSQVSTLITELLYKVRGGAGNRRSDLFRNFSDTMSVIAERGRIVGETDENGAHLMCIELGTARSYKHLTLVSSQTVRSINLKIYTIHVWILEILAA